jgi:hypothetical protein
MRNKETVNGKIHDRPCYYAFEDTNKFIYWLIPISSQLDKFQKIYDKKMKAKGICDTIHFGFVLGEKKAFLIQNMCPVIDEYINNQYINATTGSAVMLNEDVALELEKKARRVLLLQSKGTRLVFPDIFKIKEELLKKIDKSTP